MAAAAGARVFWSFLGGHSLAYGMLPFFLPVFIYRSDPQLPAWQGFIALTGLSFWLCLPLWRALLARWGVPALLGFSWLMLALLYLLLPEYQGGRGAWLLLALLNGAYLCAFWLTQRYLFLFLLSQQALGRQYGNLQIVAFVGLKIGMLLGGVWLDQPAGLAVLQALALSTALLCLGLSLGMPGEWRAAVRWSRSRPLSLSGRERWVFWLDGLFLYLESWFWLLAVQWLLGSGYSALAGVTLALSLLCAGLFYLLKNRIDRCPPQALFVTATWVYALSWGLRALCLWWEQWLWQSLLLIVIAFLTAFFRLVFNQRFYARSMQAGGLGYLLGKSHLSQQAVALGFAGLAVLSVGVSSLSLWLGGVFVAAALLAPLLLLWLNADLPQNSRL